MYYLSSFVQFKSHSIEINLNELQTCVDQIDTRTYHDFNIDKSYFKGNLIFTRGNETRMTCYDLFKRQYKQMRKKIIPLCKNSPNRYDLNLLRIITLIYHMYIEYELCNLAYNKNTVFLYESQLMHGTTSNEQEKHMIIININDC